MKGEKVVEAQSMKEALEAAREEVEKGDAACICIPKDLYEIFSEAARDADMTTAEFVTVLLAAAMEMINDKKCSKRLAKTMVYLRSMILPQ